MSENIEREQISCYLTYSGDETKKVVLENIDRSPLYNGSIKSVGPRYCPSFEDKIMRFPEKDKHQIFIEPEGEKDRKSTRLNSSHANISYAVFCLKKKSNLLDL